jgi:hypothetical protein
MVYMLCVLGRSALVMKGGLGATRHFAVDLMMRTDVQSDSWGQQIFAA